MRLLAVELDRFRSRRAIVLMLLGRPPVAGDVVAWNDARIEVTAVVERGVGEARLTRLPS